MKSVIIWTTALIVLSSLAYATPPRTIGYQGYLKDNTKTPVTATKTMGFALYSTTTGKTPIWNESQNITVDNGIYKAELGTATPINLPFDRQYYLGITVDPDTNEMTPRQPLTGVPYAGNVTLACADGGVLVYKGGVWQCGTVTTLPNAAATCVGPSGLSGEGCTISMCSPGYVDCDKQVSNGCEANITNETINCGACGNTCTAPSHMNSTCVNAKCEANCMTGWGNCNNDTASDGCETSLYTISNCGACGHVCSFPNAMSACTSGVCTIAFCNTGFANCNNIPSDGCETNILTDKYHCGNCNTVCGGIQPNCVNGACSF